MKLEDLKQQCQSLCDLQDLDESRRQEVQDAVRSTEEQWRTVLQAAEEALNKTETDDATERQLEAFKSQSESVQSWIKEQKKKLMMTSRHVPFEERIQAAHVSLKRGLD